MATKKNTRMIGGLEVRVVKDEKTHNMLINHHYITTHLAQYAMELFRAEMTSLEPMSGMAGGTTTYQSFQRTTIDHSVKRACEGAEKLFTELNRRGWLVQAPGLDEIVEPPNENGYGLTRGMTGHGHG